MNEIKIWNYDNLEIRTIEKGGESWQMCIRDSTSGVPVVTPVAQLGS